MQNEDGIATFGGRGTPQNKKMYFYEGSILPIEWTNQHGCGRNSKVNCEIIIQYMCEDTADPQVDNFWPWSANKWGPSSNEAVTDEVNVGKQAFRSGIDIAAPRDGIPRDSQDAATDTIPKNAASATPNTKETRRFGMHENFDYYDRCEHTSRNLGLYTADQRMRRNDQRATRQNPNGNRNGFECPEERDYYPSPNPTPWIDIAILTNEAPKKYPCTSVTEIEPATESSPAKYACNKPLAAIKDNAPQEDWLSARCAYYLGNSMNRHKKGYCDARRDGSVQVKYDSPEWKGNKWPNNKSDCEALESSNGVKIAEWIEVSHADNFEDGEIPYPICSQTSFSRVNHLGNGDDDANIDSSNYFEKDSKVYLPQSNNANRFVWTVPNIPTPKDEDSYFSAGMEKAYESCTLRIRYNISSSDFAQWPEDAMEPAHPYSKAMVNATHNAKKGSADDYSRTPLIQDPYIYTGPGDSADKGSQFVSLAVNTNQYGRTFQDRTYKFAIKKRPTKAAAADDAADEPAKISIDADAKIFNVNVRGKRGNIVQTYPAVEYDFVPNRLALDKKDYVHFQWTGSDYNPRRGCNNGEGGPPDPNDFTTGANAKLNSRADRSNIIFMNTMSQNVPMDMLGVSNAADISGNFNERVLASKDAIADEVPCGDSDECYEQVMRLAFLNQQSDGGSLQLRGNAKCLTAEQLDAISNKNERENHPLNCAKLNAKPFPYFDGGVMKLSQGGKYAYFGSRNNNLSNRDQTGIICVRGNGEKCLDDNGVLQDENRMVSSATVRSKSYCNDEASDYTVGNNFGAASCISLDASLLIDETLASTQADNDKIGDGNKEPCDTIFFFFEGATLEEKIGLAIALLFVGMGSAWAALYAFNRYKAVSNKGKKFAGNTKWKGTKQVEMI